MPVKKRGKEGGVEKNPAKKGEWRPNQQHLSVEEDKAPTLRRVSKGEKRGGEKKNRKGPAASRQTKSQPAGRGVRGEESF